MTNNNEYGIDLDMWEEISRNEYSELYKGCIACFPNKTEAYYFKRKEVIQTRFELKDYHYCEINEGRLQFHSNSNCILYYIFPEEFETIRQAMLNCEKLNKSKEDKNE